MAIDYTTPAGQVRLLIADVEEDAQLLTDDQVAGFLTLNGGSVKRAAADALDAIASSEALVSKKIRSQDLSTDGPAVAAALRAHAADLREQAKNDDDTAAWADGDGFGVVEFRPYPCGPEAAEATS